MPFNSTIGFASSVASSSPRKGLSSAASSSRGFANPLASSGSFARSSRGFDLRPPSQAAIHRLYVATGDLEYLGIAKPVLFPDVRVPACDVANANTAEIPIVTPSVSGPLPEICDPPELLPAVSSIPPMCLEEVLASPHWQRSRGLPSSASEPGLPVARSPLAQAASPQGLAQSLGAGFGFPRRRPPGTAEAARGQKVAAGPPPRIQASGLAPAARELLAARNIAREARYKAPSTFTDGRRRMALINCLESFERERTDFTLGEISKRLLQEGWQMNEVKEHLLLLADDTDKWNVRSGREVVEQRPTQPSHLPAIVEATGDRLQATGENRGSQARCSLGVRTMIHGFRNFTDAQQAVRK